MSKFKTDKVVKLQGKEYVLFEGLLEVTHENYHLMGFSTDLIQYPTTENNMTAIVKAIVTVKDGEDVKHFSGIGDASPSSVNRMIAPHIIRMAETRALGRAMRFLTGFGTVFEELGDLDEQKQSSKKNTSNNKKEAKKETKTETEAPQASQAQLKKIEKDAKALGLSAKEVYVHLSIDPEKVAKADASKAIKFLKTDEAKGLASKEGAEVADGGISSDDLPF
jgi:hypothetical protein